MKRKVPWTRRRDVDMAGDRGMRFDGESVAAGVCGCDRDMKESESIRCECGKSCELKAHFLVCIPKGGKGG